MSEEIIKYEDIDHIGMELFRKNNDNFYRSYPSSIMSRILIAANKREGITEIKDEYYMKSSSIPNKRVYYIYSDQLSELNKSKIYDIVNFNNKECIWFYIKNTIDMIGEDPIKYTNMVYANLLSVLKPIHPNMRGTFEALERTILIDVMSIRLIYFLHDTYGVIDLEEIKNKYCEKSLLSKTFTSESIINFINDVIDNFNNKQYFFERMYLDSYMLLQEKNK